MMTSSSVTLVAGSRVPCSSSTSIPIRNCSRLNGEVSQSTPIRRPAARACSRVKGACELMPLTLDASPLRRGTSGGHSGGGCCWAGHRLAGCSDFSGGPPPHRLSDLGGYDDRQCHGCADEPLPDVKRGCLQDCLERPQDGGHDEQEEGQPGRHDECPIGEGVKGERGLPFVFRLDREEKVEQRERDHAHGPRDG